MIYKIPKVRQKLKDLVQLFTLEPGRLRVNKRISKLPKVHSNQRQSEAP